jgi:glycosyltransferase involved in cell wall biosynthesis
VSDISVIIPTWNRAATIEKAVSSALSQTFPPLEVLVCDDGSTDNSREIVHAIGDPRVRWIDGPHSGLPAVPRNRGISLARGEWLAFLDSDDEWLPEKLEKQMTTVAKAMSLAGCSNAYRLLAEGIVEGTLLDRKEKVFTFSDIVRVNSIVCSSVLVHKSVVAEVGGFPEESAIRAVEDYALWLRIATRSGFAFNSDPLLRYRDDASNSIRAVGMGYWFQRRAVLLDFLKWGLTKYRHPLKVLRVFFLYLFACLADLKGRIEVGSSSQDQAAARYFGNGAFQDRGQLNCDIHCHVDPHLIDIVTVAFNNELVIEEQIRLLRKHLLDRFNYTVADNSPDPEKRRIIRQLCQEQGVAYFVMPPNPFTGKDPSHSHGLALNWIYRNYLEPRKADSFGFIDHDIFPVRPTRIASFLEQSPVFGLMQTRGEKWYLWPGFCFFRRDFLAGKNIDFRPGKDCDSGGRNWESLYSCLDRRQVSCLKHEYANLRKGNDPQSDLYEKIGDWVHTFNASNWKAVPSKNLLVKELLAHF